MAHTSAPAIVRRGLPGTPRTFSIVGISLDPPAVAPPAWDARTVALLRKARERGVTTFDLAEARFPQRAERLFATAFPAPDPELVAIVGRSLDSLASERARREDGSSGRPLAEALGASLEQSRRRLAPVPLAVLDWDPGTGQSPGEPGPTPLLGPDGPSEWRELLWATRLSSQVSALPAPSSSPPLFTGEFSLLDDGLAPLFESADPAAGARLIVRNPFSDGRLDGSRFAATAGPSGPGEGPVDLRRLHAEFDPVLRLAFLTEGHRRTLAQAALHYVVGLPWVLTCIVPLPPPERMDEILGYAASPPLDAQELERLGRVK